MSLGAVRAQVVFKIMRLDKIPQGVNIIRIISAPQHLMVRASRESAKEWEKERFTAVEGSQEIVLFQKPKEKSVSIEGKQLTASETALSKGIGKTQ